MSDTLQLVVGKRCGILPAKLNLQQHIDKLKRIEHQNYKLRHIEH